MRQVLRLAPCGPEVAVPALLEGWRRNQALLRQCGCGGTVRDKAEPSTLLYEFRQVEQEEEERVLVGPVMPQPAASSPPPPEPVLGTCPSPGESI